MDHSSLFTITSVEKQKDSTVKLEGEITTQLFEKYREAEMKKAMKDFSAPGFRPGKAPENVFLERVNEMDILEEAAYQAIREVYPFIMEENVPDAIGMPRITITKLARNNPVGFNMIIGVVPEVKLPNYKKVAERVIKENESNEVEVSDEELETVIGQIRMMHAQQNAANSDSPPEFPEITDEFVRTLGPFANVEEFRNKIRENLKEEKATDERMKTREAIAAALIEEAKIEIPQLVIETEAAGAFDQMMEEIKKRNMTLEDYLKRIEKTEEEVRKEQQDHVTRQLKTRFVLEAIAEKEDLSPEEELVAQETRNMMQRYPDADAAQLKGYAERLLINENVLRFLEGRSLLKKPEDTQPGPQENTAEEPVSPPEQPTSEPKVEPDESQPEEESPEEKQSSDA